LFAITTPIISEQTSHSTLTNNNTENDVMIFSKVQIQNYEITTNRTATLKQLRYMLINKVVQGPVNVS